MFSHATRRQLKTPVKTPLLIINKTGLTNKNLESWFPPILILGGVIHNCRIEEDPESQRVKKKISVGDGVGGGRRGSHCPLIVSLTVMNLWLNYWFIYMTRRFIHSISLQSILFYHTGPVFQYFFYQLFAPRVLGLIMRCCVNFFYFSTLWWGFWFLKFFFILNNFSEILFMFPRSFRENFSWKFPQKFPLYKFVNKF